MLDKAVTKAKPHIVPIWAMKIFLSEATLDLEHTNITLCDLEAFDDRT